MKKGTILDIPIILIMVTLIAFVVLLVAYILGAFNTAITENPELGLNVSYVSQVQTGVNVFDGMFIVLVAGLFLATIIGAFVVRTHPVFFVMSLFLLVFFVILGVIFTDVFYEFATAPALVDTANDFPIMIQILSNWPSILGVFGIVVIIVLYAKLRSQDQGGTIG